MTVGRRSVTLDVMQPHDEFERNRLAIDEMLVELKEARSPSGEEMMTELWQDYDYPPFRLRDGWFCCVAGKQFGPWPDKGSATAGYETEHRRASHPTAKEK